jgi:hypothetical protein
MVTASGSPSAIAARWSAKRPAEPPTSTWNGACNALIASSVRCASAADGRAGHDDIDAPQQEERVVDRQAEGEPEGDVEREDRELVRAVDEP